MTMTMTTTTSKPGWAPTAEKLANLAAYEATHARSRSEAHRDAIDAARATLADSSDDIGRIVAELAELRADLAEAVARRDGARQSLRRLRGR